MSAAPADNPAKRMLKPHSQGYAAKTIYNVLADLRIIDILVQMLGYFPEKPILVCTGDKNLALFWTALRVESVTQNPVKGVTGHFAPLDVLFAEAPAGRKEVYFQG